MRRRGWWRVGSEHAEGSWAFWRSVMEMSTESQVACVRDLALSPSGWDPLRKSLASLDPVLSLLLMNWMSIQKGRSADLQVAQNYKEVAIIPKTTEISLRKISRN